MCLIIHKPAGATVPETLIRSAWEDNPDGTGLMYHDANGPQVYKVMPGDWADPARHIDSVLAGLQAREVGIHFRWKTHGPVSRDNCHPYAIPGTGGYIMHNGVLSPTVLGANYKDVADTLSDTAFYTMTVLADAPGADDPQFWELVGNDVGTANKLLMMDATGRFARVNDKHWGTYRGLRLSNMLSVPEWNDGKGWRQYYTPRATAYGTSYTAPARTDDSVLVYTMSDGKPAKLSRRDRKILNRCLRAGSWAPLAAIKRG